MPRSSSELLAKVPLFVGETQPLIPLAGDINWYPDQWLFIVYGRNGDDYDG